MIDEIIDAAQGWPDRCQEIGFDGRRTELLAEMLRARIKSLE
jgi:serine/threonine-protein kinase HipA